MLGADWTRVRTTLGVLVAHSRGAGGYRSPTAQGEIESTITGLYPYGRYEVNALVSVWGMAGYGAGELVLTPEDQAPLETDMDLVMGAVGVRGVAVEAPEDGGVELSVTSDAMAVRTSSQKVPGLEAATGDVTRLCLGLEGTWQGIGSDGSATLVPGAEVGLRHDGGDAETGFGVDGGGGVTWAHPRSGLSGEVSAHALVSHEAGGLREKGISGSLAFDPAPESERGFSLTVSQVMGTQSAGGMDALLGRGTLEGLGANDAGSGLANRRL